MRVKDSSYKMLLSSQYYESYCR